MLYLIRHAPTVAQGRLCGRTDVDAITMADEVTARVRAHVPVPSRVITSPARRCVQTHAMVFGADAPPPPTDPRLWEQDFGDHEDTPYADLPDIGVLAGDDLAAYCPPNGESFAAMCARVAPALVEAASGDGDVVIVAHAGTVRAALALAIGSPGPAMGFEVANLSVSTFRGYDGGLSVGSVNWTP